MPLRDALFEALANQDLAAAKEVLDQQPSLVNIPHLYWEWNKNNDVVERDHLRSPLSFLLNFTVYPMRDYTEENEEGWKDVGACFRWVKTNIEMIRLLLSYNPDLSDEGSSSDVLTYAAARLPVVVPDLIAKGAVVNAVNKLGNRGYTALNWAAEFEGEGSLDAIRALVKAGADINVLTGSYNGERRTEQGTPLFHAVLYKEAPLSDPVEQRAIDNYARKVIALLLELDADIHSPTTDGRTPMGMAIETGRYDLFSLIARQTMDFSRIEAPLNSADQYRWEEGDGIKTGTKSEFQQHLLAQLDLPPLQLATALATPEGMPTALAVQLGAQNILIEAFHDYHWQGHAQLAVTSICALKQGLPAWAASSLENIDMPPLMRLVSEEMAREEGSWQEKMARRGVRTLGP